MRKKLSEMTPFERVKPRLKGLSNEEAEEVAITILAQIMAKHRRVFKDFDAYMNGLLKRMVDATIEYELSNASMLALGAISHELYGKDAESEGKPEGGNQEALNERYIKARVIGENLSVLVDDKPVFINGKPCYNMWHNTPDGHIYHDDELEFIEERLQKQGGEK